jgi:hypothetical protein
MAIKTGIGVGSAQVFDTSGLVGNFAKMLQKQQQDEAKFQTEIADLIAKVDTKGVRDADKMEIANMYDATKELYRQAAQAKNFQEKALLRSKISKAVNDINEYAQNSAGWVKKYDSLARDVASNPWSYEPTVVERLRGLKDKPLSQMGADIALDPFEFQKVPNIKSRDNVFDDIRKRGEQFAVFTTQNIGGGQKQYIGKLGDDKIREIINVNLATNPEYKATVFNQWSKMNPGKQLDPNEIINSELSLYKSQYGTEYKRDPRDIAKEKSGDGEDKLTYRQGLISGLINKDKGSLAELVAMLPANSKAQYTTSRPTGESKGGFGGIRVTIPAASSPTGLDIVEDIPLQAGKPIIKINSLLNEYSGEKISPSLIAIKGGKKTGERFEVEPSNQPKQLQIKESDITSKAQAAGYSVSEYKKLLQQKGVKIVK